MLRNITVVSTLLMMSIASHARLTLNQVEENILKTAPDIQIDKIEETNTPDIYKVYVEGRSHLLFVNEELMIVGNYYQIGNSVTVNERIQSENALAALNALDASTLIRFGDESLPLHVTMFTDIDCGYCRKVQAEMDQYNAAGIRFTEVLFPAAGPESESWVKAQKVWCADDRAEAIVIMKSGGDIESKDCDSSGLITHFQAGIDAGIVGTPLLISDDGTIIQGYVAPSVLAARLAGLKDSEN